jgi:lysophospholipid acyltransferase (LPLAT)-like uncharacterized protein
MADKKKYSLGKHLTLKLGILLASWVLRAIFITCRVEVVNKPLLDKLLARQMRTIGTLWHRASIYFLYYFREIKPTLMVSNSRDGDYLARFVELMGGTTVRGSSRHGGVEALHKLAKNVKTGKSFCAASACDGPGGPRYKAKKGMIFLAQRTGLPLVPVLWSADRAWVLRKSWDLTMIPKPFARIKLAAGKVFNYPPKMTAQEMEKARQELEDELNRMRRELDAACGQTDME